MLIAFCRSPNWKSIEGDENKPNIMSLKIPDFIVEDQKESENLFLNKSNSENDTDNFWNKNSKPQPFIKDFLLQEW